MKAKCLEEITLQTTRYLYRSQCVLNLFIDYNYLLLLTSVLMLRRIYMYDIVCIYGYLYVIFDG